mgnify:CR=1 FL=1
MTNRMKNLHFTHFLTFLIFLILPIYACADIAYSEIKLDIVRDGFPSYSINVTQALDGEIIYFIVKKYDSRDSFNSNKYDESELLKISDATFRTLTSEFNAIDFVSIFESYHEDYMAIDGDSWRIYCNGKGFSFKYWLHDPMTKSSIEPLLKFVDKLNGIAKMDITYKDGYPDRN